MSIHHSIQLGYLQEISIFDWYRSYPQLFQLIITYENDIYNLKE